MSTEKQNLTLDDALEAVDEVADEIADEDMHGATREMVAEGTAQRIRERLRIAAADDSDGPDLGAWHRLRETAEKGDK